YKYLFHDYNENDIKPGKFWKDNRDPRYGRLLCNVARYANTTIPLHADNLPQGIVAEAYRQQHGKLRGVEVQLVNFLGGVIKEGVVPLNSNINFPIVKSHLPHPDRPITISVRARQVRQVFVLSTDFDGVVQLPFSTAGEYTTVRLPTFHNYFI